MFGSTPFCARKAELSVSTPGRSAMNGSARRSSAETTPFSASGCSGDTSTTSVVDQRRPVKIPVAAADDAEIRPSPLERAGELRAHALEQPDVDSGIAAAERGDQAGKRPEKRGVGRPDIDLAALDAAQGVGDPRRSRSLVRQLAQVRQESAALPRRADAVPRSDQQREADLRLERGHHPADARRRVAELLRGGGEAAQLQRAQQRGAFLGVRLQIPQKLFDHLSLYARIRLC